MRNMHKLIYDIRTKENAIATLEKLTGIQWYEWVKNSNRVNDYKCADYFIQAMLEENGILQRTFEDMSIVFSHITTSATRCE